MLYKEPIRIILGFSEISLKHIKLRKQIANANQEVLALDSGLAPDKQYQ